MTENSGAYRVGIQQREVVLRVKQGDQIHTLKHVLDTPNSADWIEYDRGVNSIVIEDGDRRIVNNAMAARIALYNKKIMAVHGYINDHTGEVLKAGDEGWLEMIPALHKSEVIATFGEVISIGGELEKN